MQADRLRTSAARLANGVLSLANDLDHKTIEQVTNSARLPFVHEPVAIMTDAHLGYGVPIGTVIATNGAIIPSAVGVDIGCGMAAQKLSCSVTELDWARSATPSASLHSMLSLTSFSKQRCMWPTALIADASDLVTPVVRVETVLNSKGA